MKVASVANSKRHINLIPWGAETPQGTNVGLRYNFTPQKNPFTAAMCIPGLNQLEHKSIGNK